MSQLKKFKVDSTCILCNFCVEQCPDVFELQHEGRKAERQSLVIKQPEDEIEVSMCEDALHGCPVEAIEYLD